VSSHPYLHAEAAWHLVRQGPHGHSARCALERGQSAGAHDARGSDACPPGQVVSAGMVFPLPTEGPLEQIRVQDEQKGGGGANTPTHPGVAWPGALRTMGTGGVCDHAPLSLPWVFYQGGGGGGGGGGAWGGGVGGGGVGRWNAGLARRGHPPRRYGRSLGLGITRMLRSCSKRSRLRALALNGAAALHPDDLWAEPGSKARDRMNPEGAHPAGGRGAGTPAARGVRGDGADRRKRYSEALSTFARGRTGPVHRFRHVGVGPSKGAGLRSKCCWLPRGRPKNRGLQPGEPTGDYALPGHTSTRHTLTIREIEKLGRHAVDSNGLFYDELPVACASCASGEVGRGF
jgi:hypothetical protein